MNIVLQNPAIRTPLKAFWNWLTDAPAPMQVSRVGVRPVSATATAKAPRAITLRTHLLAGQPTTATARRNAHRPLRTVRVMEAGQAPGQVGRMVMSGRMADVCAELDRLAACEARLH
jgi:hypothetical protein